MRTRALMLLSALAAASAAADDSSSEETRAIHSAVPVDSSFDGAPPTLAHLGFTCSMSSGEFTDEQGEARNADEFLLCAKESPYMLLCSRHTNVIVLAQAHNVREVFVTGGLLCP